MRMLNNLLRNTIFLSLSGSIIALIILVIQPFIKSRISKTWQYYIWLAVLLRMTFSFKPKNSVLTGLRNLLENTNRIIPNPAIIRIGEIVGSFSMYIGLIWIMIAAFLIAKKIISYHQYIHFIKKHRSEIVHSEGMHSVILTIYSKIRTEMGIHKEIRLYASEVIYSPMLIGIIHPEIILPKKMLGELEIQEQVKYVLLHELTHYKRKDILYKWFIQIVLCLHFFNPLVWLIKKIVSINCELSCDEAVIRKLGASGKKSYGSALIRTMETNTFSVPQNAPNTAMSLMMCEEANQMQNRLAAINHYKQNSARVTTAAFILTGFISFCAVYIGVLKSTPCYCLENMLHLFTQL